VRDSLRIAAAEAAEAAEAAVAEAAVAEAAEAETEAEAAEGEAEAEAAMFGSRSEIASSNGSIPSGRWFSHTLTRSVTRNGTVPNNPVARGAASPAAASAIRWPDARGRPTAEAARGGGQGFKKESSAGAAWRRRPSKTRCFPFQRERGSGWLRGKWKAGKLEASQSKVQGAGSAHVNEE
jgi:hypothetical protein